MKNYVRLELIGGGGFADVWRAVLEGTEHEFAVKMLREFRDPDARHRFEREVRMLRGLRHPRVVQLVDANTSAEVPFYVMPLMRGGALTAWAGRLPPANLRLVLHQIVDFVAYLHAQGGLHRDLKPDNLLVDANGNLAVGDFGLGNNPKYTVIMTAHAVGTWGYIAPELTKADGKATTASDIYSLGATMFHLATGVHPKDAQILDPAAYRADVPLDVRHLILKMVQQDPNSRPTAAAIRGALAPKQVKEDAARSQRDDGLKVLVGFALAAAVIAALSS